MSGKIKAVRFDRVSSDDQRDGYSLDAQRDNGIPYAKNNNLNVVKFWSVSESASKEADRTEFFEMIEYVKGNQIKAVIFDKVDRACRGLKSAVLIEELMDEHGVAFHFTREHLVIDKNSPPQEKLRFSLGITLAKYYIDNLKTEIRKGIDAKLDKGVWNGKAPFGFKNTRDEHSNKAVVEVDEITAPIVQEIFELYPSGNYPLSALADLVREKLPGRIVSKRLIETVLENPFYYGMMKVRGKLIKGTHKPIVAKELFDKCQKVRGIRAAKHNTMRLEQIPKPFMDFLKCGACNHSVTGESVKKKSGLKYVYYRCANAKCVEYKKRVRQEDLFEQLATAFAPFGKWTPKATQAFIQTMHGRLQDLDLYTQKMTGELATARLEIKKRIEQLDKYHADGILSEAEHAAAVAVPKSALAAKTAEIQAYQSADLKTFEEGSRIIQLFHKAHNFMQLDANELEKIRLAKMVLSNPTLLDRTIRFSYQKPLDDLFQLTDLPVWWRRRELNPRPQVIHSWALHS